MSLQSTNLIIVGSHLPATFKGTPDDLFMRMLERMRIVSPSGTAFFIIGDTEPVNNVGPWLNTSGGIGQWFVWSEELKRYVAIDISASEKTWFHFGASTPGSADPPVWLRLSADPTEANPFPTPVSWNVWDGSAWIDFTSVQDRSITQAKLAYAANFFGVAAGVNDYVVNFDPVSAFSYGNGTDQAFAAFVKFSNANTTSVTLAVNGGGGAPVRKNGGTTELVAGEIAAGSVHLLVFDGTSFQIESPLAAVSATVHGIPNFFSPVTIYTGGTIGFTVWNTAVTSGVPADASAVIIQSEAACGFSATDSTIQIRKLTGQPTYTALAIRQSTDGESLNVTNQGIFPIGSQTFGGIGFEFSVTGTLDGIATIRLIGYIS